MFNHSDSLVKQYSAHVNVVHLGTHKGCNDLCSRWAHTLSHLCKTHSLWPMRKILLVAAHVVVASASERCQVVVRNETMNSLFQLIMVIFMDGDSECLLYSCTRRVKQQVKNSFVYIFDEIRYTYGFMANIGFS